MLGVETLAHCPGWVGDKARELDLPLWQAAHQQCEWFLFRSIEVLRGSQVSRGVHSRGGGVPGELSGFRMGRLGNLRED